MATGDLPTYGYKPSPKSGEPEIRTVTSRRARLLAGGTYFRARDPGSAGNFISVQVLEFTPYNGTVGEAYCIVTNRTLKYSENVIGPVRTSILDVDGTFADLWIIDQLHTTNARTQQYSISCQIRNAIQNSQPYTLPAPISTEPFTLGKLFSSGKLSVKAEQDGSVLTAGSTVFVSQRTKIYPLSGKSETDPDTLAITYGWDIADLRTKINAGDAWVEMLERGGIPGAAPGDPPTPNPSAPDVQDEGADALFLAPFADKKLTGGDGLPDNPNRENTGEFRTLILVAQSEAQNGEIGGPNTMYEWVGDSATVGMWKPY